jgi:hypothetical protein
VGPRTESEDDGGKIKFKKPVKRKSSCNEDRSGVLDATTSKKPKQSVKDSATTIVMGGVAKRRRRSSEGESKSRKVKNNSLLSFGDEEEN